MCVGFGTHSRSRVEAPGFSFERVLPIFAGADILFGNCECTLSETGRQPGAYHSVQMRGQRDDVTGLKSAGFTVLNVANNHSMQHGRAPFIETVRMLEESGIAVCGLRAADCRAAVPASVERNGLDVAFLGYSLRPRQYFTDEPLYAEGDREHIIADVRHARDRHDAVVVSLHWGDEFVDTPSPEEVSLAHAVMDAGAALIVGHHPHVLRGVERYGRGFIVYSLGNFVCDMTWDERMRESAVLRCTLTPDGVSELELVPVRINGDCRPEPLVGDRRAALDRRIAALSDQFLNPTPAAPSDGARDYERVAGQALRDERRRAHRHFLQNLHRYPKGIVLQQLRTFVRNRFADRKRHSEIPGRS